MREQTIQDRAIDRFILDFIDSVPHLEALLLLWRFRPKAWTDEQIGKRLYLDGQAASELMEGLVRRGLIAEVPGRSRHYRYEAGERDKLLAAVDTAHRNDLIRISTMIRKRSSRAAE